MVRVYRFHICAFKCLIYIYTHIYAYIKLLIVVISYGVLLDQSEGVHILVSISLYYLHFL